MEEGTSIEESQIQLSNKSLAGLKINFGGHQNMFNTGKTLDE